MYYIPKENKQKTSTEFWVKGAVCSRKCTLHQEAPQSRVVLKMQKLCGPRVQAKRINKISCQINLCAAVLLQHFSFHF